MWCLDWCWGSRDGRSKDDGCKGARGPETDFAIDPIAWMGSGPPPEMVQIGAPWKAWSSEAFEPLTSAEISMELPHRPWDQTVQLQHQDGWGYMKYVASFIAGFALQIKAGLAGLRALAQTQESEV